MTLDDLHITLRYRRLLADSALADVDETEAEIADANGEPLLAEWKREEAFALRHGTDRQKAHAAWLRYMAHMHVEQGTVPHGHCADEIEIVMDELRKEAA